MKLPVWFGPKRSQLRPVWFGRSDPMRKHLKMCKIFVRTLVPWRDGHLGHYDQNQELGGPGIITNLNVLLEKSGGIY